MTSAWLAADERDDHYLGLEGVNIVATDALLATRDNLADVIAAKAMMCVHGAAGLGKTLSVHASLRALAPEDVLRVQFPLAERFRVLVCDEAQWLSRECFEYWRYLWDDRRTDIAIVFVGGGDCYQVLRREPMLSSRVYVWQEFRRLSRAQVLEVIPAYHQIWADTDPADIDFADNHAGHGNFRAWAKITAHTLTACARLERRTADREVLQWVFSKLGGRGGN